MATIADHKFVYKADYAIKVLVPSIALLLVGIADLFSAWSTDLIMGFLLSQYAWIGFFANTTFAACDVLGYKWTLRWGIDINTIVPPGSVIFNRATAAYRWPQHTILVIMLGIVAIGIDFKSGLGGFILWWTGLADFLYYLISKSKFGDRYDWLTTWFWIFPAGFIWKVMGKTAIPKWAFFLNVLLGLIAWILIGVLI